MIEDKIDKLIDCMERLITALENDAPLPGTNKTPAPEPDPEEAPVDAPTIQDLKNQCLELTRANRENNPKIKKIIFDLTGKKFLKEVEPEMAIKIKAEFDKLS